MRHKVQGIIRFSIHLYLEYLLPSECSNSINKYRAHDAPGTPLIYQALPLRANLEAQRWKMPLLSERHSSEGYK